jgi:hypothetical protein
MSELKLSNVAIIAGDPRIAGHVCAHFRSPGSYVALQGAPEVRMVSEGVFANDCVRVTNVVRAHEPEMVLFLACCNEVSAELRLSMPPVPIVEVDNVDDAALENAPGFRPRTLAPLAFDHNSVTNGHVVALESGDPMALVIAQNLAVAQGGSVFTMPPTSEAEVEHALQSWRCWSSASGIEKANAREALFAFLKKKLQPLVNGNLESVSFITRSFPYGIYPFTCPTTHDFSDPFLGENVLGGIMKTIQTRLRCPVAVVIDPGSVQARESHEIADRFGRAGYLIRRAVGDRANTQDVRYLTEHLPSDFLFYSTHCGEVRGTRITEEFSTADGKKHVVTYELVKQLTPGQKPGRVEVLDLRRWLSLDGVSWWDSVGKEAIGAGTILREFLDLCKQRQGDVQQMHVLDCSHVESVRFSDALGMHNGDIYIPMPQNIGGYYHPIVFNNACSSWRELAPRFVGHGASIYIGTSVDVLDSIAFNVACKFARDASAGKSIGHALYRAQRSVVTELSYTPYLMSGYLFTHLRRLGSAALPAIVHSRLQQAVEKHAHDTREDPAHRWQVNSITHFLQKEIQLLSEGRSVRI